MRYKELLVDQAVQLFVAGAYQVTVTDWAASLTTSVDPETVQAADGLHATVSSGL